MRTVALPPYLWRGEPVIKGSLIALATPFDADNRVDYAALERLVEFHVSEGSDGLVIAGTTGESATLEKSEHTELIGTANWALMPICWWRPITTSRCKRAFTSTFPRLRMLSISP
jgi:hypothetical protein